MIISISKESFVKLLKELNKDFLLFEKSLSDSEIISSVEQGNIYYKNRYDIFKINFNQLCSFAKAQEINLNDTILKDNEIYIPLDSIPDDRAPKLESIKIILSLLKYDISTNTEIQSIDEYLTRLIDIETNFLPAYPDTEIQYNQGFAFRLLGYNRFLEKCEIELDIENY